MSTHATGGHAAIAPSGNPVVFVAKWGSIILAIFVLMGGCTFGVVAYGIRHGNSPAPTQSPPQQPIAPPAQNAPPAVQKASDGGSNTQASQTTNCYPLSFCGGSGRTPSPVADNTPPELREDNSNPSPDQVFVDKAPPLSNPDPAHYQDAENWSSWAPIPHGYTIAWKEPDAFGVTLREECKDSYTGDTVDVTIPSEKVYCVSYRLGSLTGSPIDVSHRFRVNRKSSR